MLPDKLTNEHPGGFPHPLGDEQSPDESLKPPIHLMRVREGIPKNALGAGRPDSSVAKESMKDKFGTH